MRKNQTLHRPIPNSEWQAAGQTAGIYFLRFDFGGRRLLRKVVLER